MGKFTPKKLEEKGIQQGIGRCYLNYTRSYCKLWSVGDFSIKINSKGHLQVFENINGELIKVIKEEYVLDAFIIFAKS